MERQRLSYHRHRYIAGTPGVVEKELNTLAERFGTDEIVISTFADEKEDRFRSYELLADLFLNANETEGNDEHEWKSAPAKAI